MSDAGAARKVIAELIGTFIFVFLGAGGVITASNLDHSTALIVAALANGLGLAIAVSITMNISGGHINPAVTISILLARRIEFSLAIAYILAQLFGAILAGYSLLALIPSSIAAQSVYGAPSINPSISIPDAIMLELVMTFILVMAVFGTAVDQRAPKIAGFGIGLAVFLDVLVGGNLTGAMMNPARAIGPEIAAGFFAGWYVYWIGPIVGGMIASLVYNYLLMKS